MSDKGFHEVRFPTGFSLGATGGPERRTEIVTLGSGQEQRNTRWANSRRRFNVGYGIKTLDDLQQVIAFFEERRGRLYGFRFRDPLDWKSGPAGRPVEAADQWIGTADGHTTEFQLVKQYGTDATGYTRKITKPLAATVMISANGALLDSASYRVDEASGIVQFDPLHTPQSGVMIQAGFEFDIPVRFDTDEILVNLSHFEAGEIPSIPLLELLL